MPRTLTALALAFVLMGAAATADTAFLVHGNWCGPGDAGAPPVDELDAACMRHDLCFDQVGRFDCSCDLALMDELRRRSWPSEALYQKARGIYEAIALVPCCGTREQQATKHQWSRNDHVGAVARGREAPDASFNRLLRMLTEGIFVATRTVKR